MWMPPQATCWFGRGAYKPYSAYKLQLIAGVSRPLLYSRLFFCGLSAGRLLEGLFKRLATGKSFALGFVVSFRDLPYTILGWP